MASSTTAATALPPRILTREGTFIDDSWTVLDSAAEARAGDAALLLLRLLRAGGDRHGGQRQAHGQKGSRHDAVILLPAGG